MRSAVVEQIHATAERLHIAAGQVHFAAEWLFTVLLSESDFYVFFSVPS